jgi:hypothetical protein
MTVGFTLKAMLDDAYYEHGYASARLLGEQWSYASPPVFILTLLNRIMTDSRFSEFLSANSLFIIDEKMQAIVPTSKDCFSRLLLYYEDVT